LEKRLQCGQVRVDLLVLAVLDGGLDVTRSFVSRRANICDVVFAFIFVWIN
jgi:hypothetical protein